MSIGKYEHKQGVSADGGKNFKREGGNDISESSDPTAKMVRQILGAASKFEKDSIILKLRTARKRMKAELGRCDNRNHEFYSLAQNQKSVYVQLTAKEACHITLKPFCETEGRFFTTD